ncbi:MAG TPA: 16S rRNA (uracil(1498)-N(3))-methyltransferase [Gammaproteobacteria bacterium]|nr:16S rRNA (uracil(1498)-N(3))-methyltransferase [Gammaproteobacteria bacterium]
MRITRIYHSAPLRCGDTTYLDTDASNHLIRVLRARTGAPVILFNGDGFDYHCRTLDNDTKKTSLSIESKIAVDNESNINICLMQGLSRHDRMEATIQKSIELGVNTIIPVICQRSNFKLGADKAQKKLAHWRKIAVSACEQSGRSKLPLLEDIVALNNIESLLDKNTLKIALDPRSRTTLKDITPERLIGCDHNIAILIGPEGGFNDEEIDFLEEKQFMTIRFGPRILRTETAGPAVISAIQLLWGDLGKN